MKSLIHAYAGTAGHSAWFSEDKGLTWIHPNSHSGMYLEARVWCFSSHISRADHLFAGTDMGVFRWDESNARWKHLPSAMNDVWAIAQHPHNPQTLIAGTRPAAFYRSIDGGVSWCAMNAPGISQYSEINMGPTRVTQILFDPIEPSWIWASVEIGGIYLSKDEGQSWSLHDKGLISSDVHGLTVIALHDGSRAIYATTNMGLHLSLDNAESWVHRPISSPWQYTRAITPKIGDPSIVFLTNGNGPPGNDGKLFRSTNHGFDWQEIDLPIELNSTLWCVSTHSSNPNLIFICTNLGQVLMSEDAGLTFEVLPHVFGELRALHWRALPQGTRQAPHSITRPTIKAKDMVFAQSSSPLFNIQA